MDLYEYFRLLQDTQILFQKCWDLVKCFKKENDLCSRKTALSIFDTFHAVDIGF